MESRVSDSPVLSGILASHPALFGGVLGVIVHVFEWFLLPTEMTTIGLALLTVGMVLVFWAQQWWPDVGRALAAVGTVLVLDDVVTTVFFSGPLFPGV